MVAFCDVKGDGVRSTGLATQWAALLKEEVVEVRFGGGDLGDGGEYDVKPKTRHTARGVETMRAAQPDEVATRRLSGVLDDDEGATTGVVYPLSARMLCLRCAVWGLGDGLSGFVCAAAEGLHSHQPSTFSADGIGGARSGGRLRDVCFGLRTVASAEQPNRREATSSLRWVLLDFLRSCFFVPLSPFVIASISLWYPDMTFGRGHTEDNDECVFYVQRAIWWRSNGICPSPTTFYNRIDAPRRARSS